MEGNSKPAYTGYYRPEQTLDVRRLKALSKAYWGSYWLIANSVLWSALFFLGGTAVSSGAGSLDKLWEFFWPIVGALMLLLNFVVAHHFARLVAQGRGRGRAYAFGLALYAMAVSWCFCGLGAVAVIQQASMVGLKPLGVKPGFLGLSRSDVEAKIAEIQRAQAMGAVESPHDFDTNPTSFGGDTAGGE